MSLKRAGTEKRFTVPRSFDIIRRCNFDLFRALRLKEGPPHMKNKQKFRFGLFLVTIGIVYGDIGTSPLYVMKSILEGRCLW